jgi:hypothetical protein
VNSPTYRITKLAPKFDLGAFDCGESAYNQWLIEYAVNAVESGSSMVYLLLERAHPGAEERVVGYYAICPTMVLRDDMPKSLQRRALRTAPAWLLAKLALDKSRRGDKDHQWGAQLLREALETIVASVDLGGGQIIVVDAGNPGLIDWYSRHGFKSTGGQDLRLYMKVATARKYLEQQ